MVGWRNLSPRCRCFCSQTPIPPPHPLLRRPWMLPSPATPIHKISISSPPTPTSPCGGALTYSLDANPHFLPSSASAFYLVRDDLLHPLVNGNKARKLDAIIPLLHQFGATDLVTCGGCQSAHAAAVAVCCAERGIRSHLLLRGERLGVPTGYNLVSLLYGNVQYVERSVYAQREEMLQGHAFAVAGDRGLVFLIDDLLLDGSNVGSSVRTESTAFHAEDERGSKRVVVVNEGAGGVSALFGLVRLVWYLSQTHLFGNDQQVNLIVDAGTGTTAVGLALGVSCLGLPWKITAVMLADTIENYIEHERCLKSGFKHIFQSGIVKLSKDGADESNVEWVNRIHSRRFGKVMEGEIETCRQIARQTGVLVDPIYTLAAWEYAVLLAHEERRGGAKVVMIHTGGTLGMFGLAQRYTSQFGACQTA